MIDAFDRFWNQLEPSSWGLVSIACWALVGLGALSLLLLRRPAARGAGRRLWIALAVLGPLACVEMRWPRRFRAMGAVRGLVGDIGGAEAVDARRPWQAAMIVVALGISAAMMFVVVRSFRRWTAPTRLAAAGLLVAMTGFALEIISLHQVDAHYGVYWSLWFAGHGMMLAAIARAWGAGAEPAATRRPDDASGRRTYRIPGATAVAPADPPEPIGPRLARLAWIAGALAAPEVVAWFGL